MGMTVEQVAELFPNLMDIKDASLREVTPGEHKYDGPEARTLGND